MTYNAEPERPRVRVTSFDVAERAGVSQSTVSRALSGSPAITEVTRRKVETAAADLDYHVDERAAQLRRGHSKTVAVVVIARPGQPASQLNPFAYALLGSICTAAAARGKETLVSFQAEEDQFYGHYVERGQAEGMIVIGTSVNRPAWDYFGAIGAKTSAANPDGNGRTVFWGSPFDDMEWVRSDNLTGGRIATERLIEAGCKDIAFVGPVASAQHQFRERYDGYVEALKSAGLKPHLVEMDASLDRNAQGRAGIAQLLGSTQPCDGIFAACDAIAFGAMEALQEAGKTVPADVSVIGFDGLTAGQLTSPALTTIEPDFVAAGTLLVESVLDRGGEAENTRAPVRLLDRASV